MLDAPGQRVPVVPVARGPKFADPDRTAAGEARASVALERLETLWFNTGTLCNITCSNCYIESSPTNDLLAYMGVGDVARFLDEIESLGLGTREIGFTGGEPFMNPEMTEMAREALSRGHEVLILTNAMTPMQRPKVKAGLEALLAAFGTALTLRVSLDHYEREFHERERGPGAWEPALEGLDWLAARGFRITVAGRTCWGETEKAMREGFARLFAARGCPIDAFDPHALVLLPEMDERADVPEITTACWGKLGVSPAQIMCATSRMVIKRKGEDRPVVVPCTLLPYDRAFEMGTDLHEAAKADGGMFDDGRVKLCHPHCARFCVLGGGSCSN